MASKGVKDTTIGPDISQLRNPIQISGKPIEQVLKGIHYGSPELRCLLLDECDLIFECKVCRALFRDLPNFISHKRVYCTKSSLEDRHIGIASLPEEKVIVIQPQAPEEVNSSLNKAATQKPAKPSLDETIQRIQSGELGKSQAYKVYTEAAEKLQKQKETMKIATIRTTPIPGNKNAVFIDVNTTSVNIHERQQQQSANNITSLGNDSSRADTPANSRNKKSTERAVSHSTRHLRKPTRKEKNPPEPQKLLLEQLKEIQHKVKQKTASQDSADKTAKQRSTIQDNSSSTVKSKAKTGNLTLNTNDNENNRKNVEDNAENNEKSQPKDSENLSSLARQNFLSLLAKEEVKTGAEMKDNHGKVSAVITRKKNHQKWPDKSKQSATEAAKEIVKNTARENRMKCSLTCVKCGSIFSSRKSLGFHMKIHHSPKRTFYQCPYCPSSFYYFFGITRHLFNNHSKTADEIDKMRAQLRDKAIVKPAPPPKQKKDMFEVKSSRRRAAYQQASVAYDGVSPTSKIVGKPQENSTKVSNAFHISGETIVLHDSSDSDDNERFEIIEPRDSSPSKSKNVKTPVREGDSEANKHFDMGSSVGPVESDTDGTTVMPGHIIEVYQSCPKCQRSFSRKRLFENHIKICQSDVSLVKNTNDKTTSPAKSKGTSSSIPNQNEEVADSKLLALKNKLLSSTFGLTRVADTRNLGTKGKGKNCLDETSSQGKETLNFKASALKDKLINTTFGLSRVVDVKIVETRSKSKEISDDNLECKKIEVNIQTRRSASLDRDVSRTSKSSKSDTEKDKRDSSTESIQSNSEGRPARSRRAVPSKYAVVTNPVQKSPQKADNLGKNDQSSAKTSPENALPLPKLQKKPEVNGTSNSNIALTNAQIIFPMPKLLKRPDIDEKNVDTEIKSSPILVAVPKLQKKPDIDNPVPVSQTAKGSLSSAMETRHKTNKNSYRMMVMGLVKKKEMLSPTKRSSGKGDAKRPLGCPQKTYFSPRIPSGSPTSSPQNHFSSRRISASPQRHYVTHSSHRRSLSAALDAQKESMHMNNVTDTPSAKETSGNDQSDKIDETDVKIKKSDSVANETTDKNVLATVPHEDETQKTSSVMENVESVIKSDNIDSENSKPSPKDSGKDSRSTPQLPVSALSERPKRKRKVPNRNLDAEEMLSKIHNREPAMQNKKIRMSEAKLAKPIEDKQSSQPKTEQSLKAESELKEISNKGMDSVSDSRKNVAASNATIEDVNDNGVVGVEETEEPVKSKGRVVSNRIYVLNESKSKVQKLKCYDQTRVAKYIDVENTSCLQCGEMCTSISNLRRHIIRQHLKWSRFKCKLCRFESYDRSECTTHLFRTHKKIAAHNFSSKRSLNSLIIDLVKQGLEARILKKTKTLLGKQQSRSEGNIYARPNVKKGPRLPERAAAAAMLSTQTSQKQVSVTGDNADVSEQTIKSNPLSSTSSISPPETRLKAWTTRNSRKIIPAEKSSTDLDASTPKTESGVKRVEYWFALLPDGKFERIPPPDTPIRNYGKTNNPEPKNQTSSDELVLQTRKGKYTKRNMLPGTSLSDRKDNEKNIESKADSVTMGNTENKTMESNSFKSVSTVTVPEKSTSVTKTPNSDSKAETGKPSPQFVKGQPVAREITVAPPPSKAPVKYIITPTSSTKVVDKSPRNQLAVNKIREVTAENSPALSDQLAKSLMKLKKLGDSMTSSTALPSGFTPKVSSIATQAIPGIGSTSAAKSNPAEANASKPTPKVPITVVGKSETPQGMISASSQNSLSLSAGSAASSFVLTRGASGKIIVYTHATEDKQTTQPSTSTPLKTALPTSLSTSKITVKSKDPGSKPATEANFDDDSLPSGRYFIHQHFL